MAGFQWTIETERAAELIAEGKLTNQKIAEACGVVRMTLYNWSKHPDFAARVELHLEEFRAESRRRGIALQERRLGAIIDRHDRMSRKIDTLGDEFNRDLYKTALEHEKQMAQELGQWIENTSVVATVNQKAVKPEHAENALDALLKSETDEQSRVSETGSDSEHEASDSESPS